jgi:hypothetical protein
MDEIFTAARAVASEHAVQRANSGRPPLRMRSMSSFSAATKRWRRGSSQGYRGGRTVRRVRASVDDRRKSVTGVPGAASWFGKRSANSRLVVAAVVATITVHLSLRAGADARADAPAPPTASSHFAQARH